MTRVAGWWRAWIERRIPLMEPEPSRVDLLDGVGLTPVSEQDEPETEAEAAESPDSTEWTASDKRHSHPTPEATCRRSGILPRLRRAALAPHDSKTGRSSCCR